MPPGRRLKAARALFLCFALDSWAGDTGSGPSAAPGIALRQAEVPTDTVPDSLPTFGTLGGEAQTEGGLRRTPQETPNAEVVDSCA